MIYSTCVRILCVCVLMTLTFALNTLDYSNFEIIKIELRPDIDSVNRTHILKVVKKLTEDYYIDRLSQTELIIPKEFSQTIEDTLIREQMHYYERANDVKTYLSRQKEPIFVPIADESGSRNEINCEGFIADSLFIEARLPLPKIIERQHLRYCPIVAWLNAMKIQYSYLMKIEEIGKTHHGRIMLVVKINDRGNNKKVVVVEAGSHARDWGAISSALNLIAMLLHELSRNQVTLLNDYAFHIIPVVNPDGFEYSHLKDRLWKKNLTPTNTNMCVGTDLDKNFDSYWGDCDESKETLDPCRNVYKGKAAASEKETTHISNYMLTLKGRVKLSISVQLFGQYLILPFSNGKYVPSNILNMVKVADTIEKAIFNNHRYTFVRGNHQQIMGFSSCGSFMDWMVDKMEVPYAYTLRHGIPKDLVFSSHFYLGENGKRNFDVIKAALWEIGNIENTNKGKDITFSVFTSADGMLIEQSNTIVGANSPFSYSHTYRSDNTDKDVHTVDKTDILNDN